MADESAPSHEAASTLPKRHQAQDPEEISCEDELKDLVPDAELSLPAFNVVTGSYDPRSLKSTLLEFKTMRYGVQYTAVPRATAVDRFERSLLGDIQRGLAARDAAWHNTEPGQKGPLRDILDMSEYTGMVFGTVAVSNDGPETVVKPADQGKTKTGSALSLACPICHTTEFPLPTTGDGMKPRLSCQRCARTFSSIDNDLLDLTLTSGIEYKSYQKNLWAGTTTFQSPLVSFIYERGWRQGFAWAGFPGVDKEFDMAMKYLAPAFGEPLLDMSCGSGLFTRKFAKSGAFPSVIAADFSVNMLRQTRTFVQEDKSIDPDLVRLVRADVGRLPFASGSLPAIHAGAAIHCWPDPQQAMAEISRVLKPGGVFVASTFLNFYAPLGQIVGDDMLRPLKQIEPFTGGNEAAYKFWEEDELRDLCMAVGLTDFRRIREQRFIMYAVTKPQL
eukprot:jgi/Tetstr1/439892/TSEL_028300.t1